MFLRQKEEKLLRETELTPHKWLQHARPTKQTCPVPRDKLHNHLREIIAAKNTISTTLPRIDSVWPDYIQIWWEHLDLEFSTAEVYEAVSSLSNGKTCGRDGIYNEQLKQATVVVPHWTAFFNECFRRGQIPADWKTSDMVLIPKGKGSPSDPKSWRGISKKSCIYKLMASLLS